MKNLLYFFLSTFVMMGIFSCSGDDTTERYRVAIPEFENMQTFRDAVRATSPQATSTEDGKIYVTHDYLFYIAQEYGVHIFDNTNAENPQNVAFIEIPGVHDIAIKGQYLYADNFVDLLVFDLADLGNIQLVHTLENVINFYPDEVAFPEDVDYYDWESYEYQEGDILTGYNIEYRDEIPQYGILEDGNPATNGGQGGSYAKFQINNNALYTTDSWKINVFDITSPESTSFHGEFYTNEWVGNFETMYKLKQYLFIGSTQGMAVFDASDAFNLQYVSGFSHATGCDPVVANQDYAYLTIRGGNMCGATESQVNVIGIEDITNPSLVSSYLLEEPYGLGMHENTLFVGTGENGLKIFDAANPEELVLMNEFDINTYDVIALEDRLIIVGGQRITQFAYGENYTLEEISQIQF